MKALGLIETIGLVTAFEAADAALKAANVKLLGYENTKGGGRITIKFVGDVGAVKAAVAAGIAAALRIGRVESSLVIARPHQEIEGLIGLIDRGPAAAGESVVVPQPALEAPAPEPEAPQPAPAKAAKPKAAAGKAKRPASRRPKAAAAPAQEASLPASDAAATPAQEASLPASDAAAAPAQEASLPASDAAATPAQEASMPASDAAIAPVSDATPPPASADQPGSAQSDLDQPAAP